jgi:hypothetical protein
MQEHNVTVTLRRDDNLDIILLDLGDGNSISLQGDLRRWAESVMPPPKISMAAIESWLSSAGRPTEEATAWVRSLLDVVRAGYRYLDEVKTRGKDNPYAKRAHIEWWDTLGRFKEG